MNINTGLQSDINSSLKNLCFTRNTRANKDTIELGSLNSSTHQQALQGYLASTNNHGADSAGTQLNTIQQRPLQSYEQALNQAIVHDQRMLENIQQNWQEVN